MPTATNNRTTHDPSTIAASTTAQALGTDLQHGLTGAEAARRLARDGPNALREAATVSAWRRALAPLRDPLVGLLLLAAAVALVAWSVAGQPGWPLDALVILVVVVLNAVIGWLQEAKARSAVAALAHMTQASASVLREGQLLRIPSTALVLGDLLVLAEGDAVGADARLVEAADLRLLEAPLTGESAPVHKNTTTLPAPVALGDRLNMVFHGTAVAQSSGRAVVTATGMQSELGAIAHMLDTTADAPTPLQREIAHIGRVLGLAAVAIAVVVVLTILALHPVHTAADLVPVLLLGISLAVAVVPEGLPAILSVVLALGVQRMAARHAIVKSLASAETLGAASVIATDKTGTLTRAEMTIVRVVTASGTSQVTGVGYDPTGRVEHAGAPLPAGALHLENRAVLSGGSLAGNAALQQAADGSWRILGDPTEAAFLVAEQKLGSQASRLRRFSRIAEIPFTADRQRMSTIEADHDHGGAPVLITKGAPGVVLALCRQVRVGASTVALDAAMRQRILAEVDGLADAALRTLAVAYRPLAAAELQAGQAVAQAGLEQGLVYVGTVGIIDPPRAGVAEAIAQAQAAGIRVVMITGDHPRTALRIASDLGIVAPGQHAAVLSGAALDAVTAQGDAALATAMQRTAVFARVAPRHKLQIVRALQAGGAVVAMTGDGVNDAPALKAADIGIAMGITGTEVTKEAARMILADDNFSTIVAAVREGRGVRDNIRKFLRYLLSSNLGEVLTVFGGVVGAGLIGLDAAGLRADTGAAAAAHTLVLPLLATQILWINLITDAGPALAMGVDPVDDNLMARPPQAGNARVIDTAMWAGIAVTGTVMAALTLLTMDLLLPGGLVNLPGGGLLDAPVAGPGDLVLARTAGFTVLVLAQLFNCFNARSASRSAFHGLLANRWLWATVALSAALQVAVVHLGALNQAFGTTPLTAAQWALCLAMASGVLWCGELQKLALRRWAARGSARRTAPVLAAAPAGTRATP